MNTDEPERTEPAEEERAVAFYVAVYEAYTALKEAKRMVGAQRSRPKSILRHLEDIEAHLDTIYTEASLRQTALRDVTKIAQELRRAYDQVVNDAETAYQEGWQDALKQVLENAPGDSGTLVAWLIRTMQTDSAWQAPEWEGVIALIREARRYLTAGSRE